MPSDLSAKCRKCGKPAPVNEFVLDPNFKMMVCKNCLKESRSAASKPVSYSSTSSTQQKPAAPVKERPKGWDSEDEYLEKIAKKKDESSIKMTPLADGKALYNCKKCKRDFKYNLDKGTPANCPNCGTPVGRMIPY
jgi:DNA-directed RNA polymerase subunit RPC12/RpoP